MAKEHLQPTLLSTAVAAGLAAATMPAHALSLGISGQINKQIMHVDNGNDSAIGVYDNANSGSRFRFTGSEDIGNGLKVGGVWEWQWSNTPSNKQDFNDVGEIDEASASSLGDRKSELYFSGKWGKVSLGKGDGAGNGATEVNFSGTAGTTLYVTGASDQFGGFTFRDSNNLPVGDPFSTGDLTVGAITGAYDLFSRNQRIRYDTPKFANWITASVSRGQANLIEGAVRFDGEVGGGIRIAGAIASGTAKDEGSPGDNPDTTITGGSASVLLKNGLNFTVSYSMQEVDGVGAAPDEERTSTWFGVGYNKGKHAVSIGFGQNEFDTGDPLVDDAEPTNVGVGYHYQLAKDVELYASYITANADDMVVGSSGSLDDISALTVGSRIKWK